MKILVLLCFLFYTLTPAHSQVKYNKTKVPKLPRTGSNIVYTASVALDPSYSKELLFNNGVQWYKRNFQSADNRLSINDADAGRLSGAGITHAGKHEKEIQPQDIFFTTTITVAKGGYAYSVDSIYSFENWVKFYYSDMYSEELYTQAKPKWTKPYRQSILGYMDKRILEMTDGLRADMAKK
jgi:Domain of unknown function (DUF4468) with TBP-like fold